MRLMSHRRRPSGRRKERRRVVLCVATIVTAWCLSLHAWSQQPTPDPANPDRLEVEMPSLVLSGIDFTVSVSALDERGDPLRSYAGALEIGGATVSCLSLSSH